MAKLYFKKITGGEVNPATERAWTIDDVPERWREEVALLIGDATN
jgi:hypothetical protein